MAGLADDRIRLRRHDEVPPQGASGAAAGSDTVIDDEADDVEGRSFHVGR